MPSTNFALWSDKHPSKNDLRLYGPAGAVDPRDAAVTPAIDARVDGPQWAIDAWTVAYLALERGSRRLSIPEDVVLPKDDFLVNVPGRKSAAAG